MSGNPYNNPYSGGGGGGSSGSGDVVGPSGATDNALVRYDGATGKLLQDGILTSADINGDLAGPTDKTTTTGAGLGFTNQPNNDGVEIISNNAGDTQTATIIGTTTGTDTVVVEDIVLQGLTETPTVKTDWGVILAVKLSSAAVGTVTIREASGNATITTITAGNSSKGVETVAAANQSAWNHLVKMVASGSSTKQIGLKGTDSAGSVIYDSQALSGTTIVQSNSSFVTITEIYTGDLESSRTCTVTTYGYLVVLGGLHIWWDSSTSTLKLFNGASGFKTGLAFNNNVGLTIESFSGGLINGTNALPISGSILAAGSTTTGNAVLRTGVGCRVVAGNLIGFTNSTTDASNGAFDCTIARIAAGDMQISGATAATIGALRAARVVAAEVTSPETIATTDSRKVITNEGAAGSVTYNLPAAAAGLEYIFIVQSTNNMVVTAAGGDTIRIAAGVSSAGGTATNGTIGGFLQIIAINGTEWIAGAVQGTWTLA